MYVIHFDSIKGIIIHYRKQTSVNKRMLDVNFTVFSIL